MDPKEFIKIIQDLNRYGFVRSLSLRLSPFKGELAISLDGDGAVIGRYSGDVPGAFDHAKGELVPSIKKWLKKATGLITETDFFCTGFVFIDEAVWRFDVVDACLWQLELLREPTGHHLLTGVRIMLSDISIRLGTLSDREYQVLRWIAETKSDKEISEILKISDRTVGKHVENILRKLGVENRYAAALIYWEASKLF